MFITLARQASVILGRRGVRWAFAFTVFMGTVLVFSRLDPGRQVRAGDDEEDDLEKPEYVIPHGECSFFTERREKFLRAGLNGHLLEPAGGLSLSYVTGQVVNALPSVPTPPSRSRSGALRETTTDNYIDGPIFTALRSQGIAPAGPATNQEFLRRVTLDLIGRIPTAAEVVQFLSDSRPNKRTELIESLLNRPEWADRWAMFFGDLYGNTINTPHLNRYQGSRDAFHYYLVDSLRANKPYDDMTRELITGTGNSYEVGQANFPLTGRTTGGPAQDTYDTQAVNAATMFLGIGAMDCVLCHDGAGHLDSLSVWGTASRRVEAWGMAAFFARTNLTLPAGSGARPWIISDVDNRSYNLNTTTGNRPARRPSNGRTFMPPRYMFGGGEPNPGENWREALARLLTADLQFARATVNYVWREFMVLGIVEPPDQFDPLRLDPANPPPAPWTMQPSHQQLLESLAKNFARNNFDLKAVMRDITNSRAYQLSARYPGNWNPSWERLYARKLVRRLDAEEIHDAVVLSSGVLPAYVINGFREPRIDFAMQLPDVVGIPGGVGSPFLDSFMRGNRYDSERRSDPTILQALNLMNSSFVGTRIRNVSGTLLNRLINLPNEQLVEQLYLHVLSRYPTAVERETGLRKLSSGVRANQAEDLVWGLYNKVDFIFNY